MLIRIAGHYPMNPKHIDKLICIKGLPEEWIFKDSVYGGKELVKPWIPDIDENIPKEIRHLCDPVEITIYTAPINSERKPVIDKRTILGIKFEYGTNPGQELWDKIERYLDRMTPRDQKVPVPVLVAPDHKSSFSPHISMKNPRGALELFPAEIPVVDLRKEEPKPVEIEDPKPIVSRPVIEQVKVVPDKVFLCSGCNKEFKNDLGLEIHNRRMHKGKKVLAEV